MRTTVELPDSLVREINSLALQQGVKLQDLLTSYIEAGVSGLPAAPPLTYQDLLDMAP